MALIIDTGIAYAYYDRRDDWHSRSVELLGAEPGELVLPSPVIPEIDHLVGTRLGREARMTFYSGLVEGAYFVADLPRDGYQRALELNEQFADLDLGFVDASVVVIAARGTADRHDRRARGTADRHDRPPSLRRVAEAVGSGTSSNLDW